MGSQLQMCDYFGFPHISRIFYMKDSLMSNVYTDLKIESKFPHLYGWFIKIRSDPNLQSELIPAQAFKYWLEELMTVPMGKKPALRLPMKL